MKKALVVGALLIALSVTGCGKIMNALSTGNSGQTNQPKAVDASQFQINTSQGYVAFDKSLMMQLSAQVLVPGNPPHVKPRTVTGESLYPTVAPLNLHAPQNGTPPGVISAATQTGQLSLLYNDNGSPETRVFNVYNWTTIVDTQFSTYYISSVQLNTAWLFSN